VVKKGFTLAEVLVVIAIIALLAGVLLTAVSLARKSGTSIRTAADLQAISAGLEQYKADHGFYPPVEFRTSPFTAVTTPANQTRPTQINGSIVLTLAMLGPANRTENPVAPSNSLPYVDGQDGPGFRTSSLSGLSTRTYGPYLQADRFRVKNVLAGAAIFPVLVDANDIPILYIPATRGSAGDTSAANSFVGPRPVNPANPRPLFDLEPAILSDEIRPFLRRPGETTDANTLARVRRMLGELKANPNGSFIPATAGGADVNVLPVGRQTFLLWTAGNDGKFFPDSPLPTPADLQKNDDVTNFRGAGQ
jgi:prepilin-type N-terminal cleavage/methylation domain-containing protein